MFKEIDLEAMTEGEGFECELSEEEDPYKGEYEEGDFLLFQ